jgi:hypothetical protein
MGFPFVTSVTFGRRKEANTFVQPGVGWDLQSGYNAMGGNVWGFS